MNPRVVSYGAGKNSTALLLGLYERFPEAQVEACVSCWDPRDAELAQIDDDEGKAP